MRCLLTIGLLLLSGCVPFHMDATISWGENQKISKSTKIDHEKQVVLTTPAAQLPAQPASLTDYDREIGVGGSHLLAAGVR